MVNPGAMEATSLLPGRDPDSRWPRLRDGFPRFARRAPELDERVDRFAAGSSRESCGRPSCSPSQGSWGEIRRTPLDLSTRRSSLAVSAWDRATVGATLADGA